MVLFTGGRRNSNWCPYLVQMRRSKDRILSQGLSVSNTIRFTFLALSLFGLAVNMIGLAYTFAALVNVLIS